MTTRSTFYSHDLRILACDGCGAPLSAAIAGGLATCSYCGATSALAARDDHGDRDRAIESRNATISESERMARLREQTSRDEPLPLSIASMLVDGRVPRAQSRALLVHWKLARTTLRERGDFISAERLFHLTRLLLPHADHAARRALLETAVEMLPDHRHRHVLRCELAIGAARLGELDAAEAWLEAVDPRPVDLLMDGALRTARATIAIARGRAGAVLAELGEHGGDIPVAGAYEEVHALLRLQALESVRRYDEAFQGAEALVRDIGEEGFARALDEHAALELLPRTQLARQRADARLEVVSLQRRSTAAEDTPALAAKVALVSSALLVTVVLVAYFGVDDGWFTVGALEAAAQRLRAGDEDGAISHAFAPCCCSVSFLALSFVTWRQVPRTLGARRTSRALAARLARAEAELAEFDRRIAECEGAP